eukprot:Clim_evm80s146 gene=Clim_evmTU80s146
MTIGKLKEQNLKARQLEDDHRYVQNRKLTDLFGATTAERVATNDKTKAKAFETLGQQQHQPQGWTTDEDSEGDVQVRNLTDLMREETRNIHDVSDKLVNSRLLLVLFDMGLYVGALAQFAYIFAALDQELARCVVNWDGAPSVIADFAFVLVHAKGILRTEYFIRDVNFLLGHTSILPSLNLRGNQNDSDDGPTALQAQLQGFDGQIGKETHGSDGKLKEGGGRQWTMNGTNDSRIFSNLRKRWGADGASQPTPTSKVSAHRRDRADTDSTSPNSAESLPSISFGPQSFRDSPDVPEESLLSQYTSGDLLPTSLMQEWARRNPSCEPLSSTNAYIRHLQDIGKRDPVLLLAYGWYLYMAVFSGGFTVRKIVRKSFQLDRLDKVRGTETFDLTDYDGDRKELKQRLREIVNTAGHSLSDKELARLLNESKEVFRRNNAVVREYRVVRTYLMQHFAVLLGIVASLVIVMVYMY